MSNRRFHLPHPAVVYLAALLVVVLLSWTGGMYDLRGVGRSDGAQLRSLLDAQGIRWMLSNSARSMAAAPVGNAILLLSCLGIFSKSGLSDALGRLLRKGYIAYKERMALLLAGVLFVAILALTLIGVFGRDHLLSGLSGGLLRGPLLDGSVFLLFLAVAVPSVVYGLTVYRLRNVDDIISGMVSLFAPLASFFLTMLIASQLIAAYDYSGLSALLPVTPPIGAAIRFFIWWLPLPLIFLRK